MSSSPKSESHLHKFLDEFKCCSPVFPNDFGAVIRTSNDATISTALKVLIENKIQALPIVDHKTGKPLYILSMMNLMDYLIQAFKEDDFKTDFSHHLRQLLEDKAHKIGQIPLSKIEATIDYKLDDVVTIDEQESILAAAKIMVDRKTHRVLALSTDGYIRNLITLSRIMQFVGVMLDSIPQASKQISEIGIGSTQVFTVRTTDTALHAFKIIKAKRVSGLPVVDEQGCLVGSISASDLKLIGYDMKYWNLLGSTVQEYLQEIASTQHPEYRSHLFNWTKEASTPSVCIKCKKTDTLKFAIKMINFYRVHRIYVVDDSNKPVSVISLEDILADLIKDF